MTEGSDLLNKTKEMTMNIELSEFEAQCTLFKLRGISNETITKILQDEKDYEIKEDVVNFAIKRASHKINKQLDANLNE
jgi:hypothetical protein